MGSDLPLVDLPLVLRNLSVLQSPLDYNLMPPVLHVSVCFFATIVVCVVGGMTDFGISDLHHVHN